MGSQSPKPDPVTAEVVRMLESFGLKVRRADVENLGTILTVVIPVIH